MLQFQAKKCGWEKPVQHMAVALHDCPTRISQVLCKYNAEFLAERTVLFFLCWSVKVSSWKSLACQHTSNLSFVWTGRGIVFNEAQCYHTAGTNQKSLEKLLFQNSSCHARYLYNKNEGKQNKIPLYLVNARKLLSYTTLALSLLVTAYWRVLCNSGASIWSQLRRDVLEVISSLWFSYKLKGVAEFYVQNKKYYNVINSGISRICITPMRDASTPVRLPPM